VASVELVQLTKRYGNQAVVDGVDLTINHGELVCLLGPSGCGKTTTLRLIAGFIEPSDGEIRVGDRLVSNADRTLPPEARNMSMIFQSYALWPHMTVAQNVAYGLTLRKLERDVIATRVQAALRTVRLEQYGDRYPGELSGGQQQRVALARALIVEPETLLLDEPLSNLDAHLREEMRFEVRRLHDEFRYTTVYVTHDQSEAMTTADRIVVMNLGRIEQAGTPEELYERPNSEFVAQFLGGSNLLRGKAADSRELKVGPLTLRSDDGTLKPGQSGAISIRHHHVELSAQKLPDGPNVFGARVARQVFLGANRDYLVTMGNGETLRAVTASDVNLPSGSDIWVRLPPERCRALTR
jgi:iron(III) transport system ATP-binding protein